jgi:hypothetical protein
MLAVLASYLLAHSRSQAFGAGVLVMRNSLAAAK